MKFKVFNNLMTLLLFGYFAGKMLFHALNPNIEIGLDEHMFILINCVFFCVHIILMNIKTTKE